MTRQPHARRIEPERRESPASLARGLVAILVVALALVVLLPASGWEAVP